MNGKNRGPDYSSITAPVARLALANTNDMARLFTARRGAGAGEAIQAALDRREQALLVHAGDDLVAYATFGVVEAAWRGAAVCALCMADVVNARDGDLRALGLEWMRYAGRMRQRRPQFAMYWLLAVRDDRELAMMSDLAKALHVLDPASREEADLFAAALAKASLGQVAPQGIRVCVAQLDESCLNPEARRAFAGAEVHELRAA